jgi:hypothetical protein
MTDTAQDVVTDVPTETPSTPAATGRSEVSWWKGTLFAALLLTAFYAVALGVMFIGGVILQAANPKRHVDTFTLFHNVLVVGIVAGLSVVWLLPPHPWAKHLFPPGVRRRAAPPDGPSEDQSR